MPDQAGQPPLWLPPGTVRAILAILLTGAVVFLAIKTESLDVLTGMAGMALGYYYKVREQESP